MTRQNLTKTQVIDILKAAKVIASEWDVGMDSTGTIYVGDDGIDLIDGYYQRNQVYRVIGYHQGL